LVENLLLLIEPNGMSDYPHRAGRRRLGLPLAGSRGVVHRRHFASCEFREGHAIVIFAETQKGPEPMQGSDPLPMNK